VGFHGTRRQFNMTFLGIIALIVLVIAGLMVLRVKSDPMEKESVREFLSDGKQKQEAPVPPKNAS
jgi:hypothetical protein